MERVYKHKAESIVLQCKLTHKTMPSNSCKQATLKKFIVLRSRPTSKEEMNTLMHYKVSLCTVSDNF